MNEEECRAEFLRLQPALEKWGELVDQKILDILTAEGIAIEIQPKYRIKDIDSFLLKAFHRKKDYANPLLEIEDKVGTRVVLLNENSVNKTAQCLEQSSDWGAKKTRDIRQEITSAPEYFNYQSIHIVVNPKEKISDVGQDLLTCEIQIRSLLQHAYAQTSHDCTYKGPFKNNSSIKRHLSKSMALMEATEDYFQRIIDIMADSNQRYVEYMQELQKLYSEIYSADDIPPTDHEIADDILGLLDEQEVPLNEIESWVMSHRDRLSTMIGENKSVLTKQPYFILMDYYFKNHRTFLKKNWPLNNESLKLLFHVEGVSYR